MVIEGFVGVVIEGLVGVVIEGLVGVGHKESKTGPNFLVALTQNLSLEFFNVETNLTHSAGQMSESESSSAC